MTFYYGIDPGPRSGCVCVISDFGETFEFLLLRDSTPADVFDFLRGFESLRGGVLEDVGACRPGQGLGSQSKLILNAGEMKGVCSCMTVPFQFIRALTWRKMLGLATAKSTAERKKLNKDLAQRLYPDIPTTADKVDALLLAHAATQLYTR